MKVKVIPDLQIFILLSNLFFLNFYFRLNKLVKIFGTVKTYKKEKNLQGAKIMYVDENALAAHFLEVANDWLYLTNKISVLRQEVNFLFIQNDDGFNSNVKNPNNNYNRAGNQNAINNNSTNNNSNNNNNNFNNPQQNKNDYGSNAHNQIDATVLNAMKDISKNKGGKVRKDELFSNLERKKIPHDKIAVCLKKFSDEGYIFEEDDYYSLQL